MMRRSNFGDSPFDFERMFERMNRQFEEMNRQFARFADSRPAHALWSQGGVEVDVAEREDSVIVTADLPGFEKAEIDLSVANDALTIRAEHDVDDAYESEHYVRRERRHHSVSRTIPLPVDVRASLPAGRRGSSGRRRPHRRPPFLALLVTTLRTADPADQ